MQDQILQALRRDAADEAVRLAREWLASAPGEAQAYRWLATALRQQGEAEAALDQLLKQRGNDPDVWYQVAEVRGLTRNIIGLHQARAEYFALVGDYRQAIQQLDFAQKLTNNFQLSARLDARKRELMDQERALKEMMN